MKRLLVLMMCAMLAVPSVGMNVQASETNVLVSQTNENDDINPLETKEKEHYTLKCHIQR